MSIMSVQIQCKSSLNQELTDKLKSQSPMEGGVGGGKNGPALSFPTPLLRSDMQLAICFLNLNLNFSLEQDNHECSDTVQE